MTRVFYAIIRITRTYFTLAFFLFSCAPKSFFSKNPYALKPGDSLRTDGVFYGSTKIYDPVKKEFSQQLNYVKFYPDGRATRGIANDISLLKSMVNENNENRYSPKNKNEIRFAIENSKVFVEAYNGYRHSFEYEVYSVINKDTIVYLGVSDRPMHIPGENAPKLQMSFLEM